MTAPASEQALDVHAEIWRATAALRRVPLDVYLADPHRHVLAHLTPPAGWGEDAPPRPLLPAQRAVAHRLALAAPGLWPSPHQTERRR